MGWDCVVYRSNPGVWSNRWSREAGSTVPCSLSPVRLLFAVGTNSVFPDIKDVKSGVWLRRKEWRIVLGPSDNCLFCISGMFCSLSCPSPWPSLSLVPAVVLTCFSPLEMTTVLLLRTFEWCPAYLSVIPRPPTLCFTGLVLRALFFRSRVKAPLAFVYFDDLAFTASSLHYVIRLPFITYIKT